MCWNIGLLSMELPFQHIFLSRCHLNLEHSIQDQQFLFEKCISFCNNCGRAITTTPSSMTLFDVYIFNGIWFGQFQIDHTSKSVHIVIITCTCLIMIPPFSFKITLIITLYQHCVLFRAHAVLFATTKIRVFCVRHIVLFGRK